MAAGRLKGWGVLALAGLLAGLLGGAGCEEQREGRERVEIKGQVFWLEPALDDATRIRGLSGRMEIAPDGGMVFVFAQPAQQEFVMRHCLTDMDIAFLDGAGRVLSWYEMKVEEPQRPGESDLDYELRLKRYASRFASQFVIEVAPGTLNRLGVKEGDTIGLDAPGLKARVLRADGRGG
ncbi:MAG TPA: hypothetical protein DEB06_05745 [Phycisphaerales bacterium]|nr:hypothetical protein [Phycisphaerales bacterium]